MIDISFAVLAVPFCQEFLNNVCNNVLYETGKEKLVQKLKSNKLPVNQDIERAVRNSYYLAAEQVVKHCIRAGKANDTFEQRSLELLIDHFFSSKRNIQHVGKPNAFTHHFEYLDFTTVNEDQLGPLKLTAQNAITEELDTFLKAYKKRYLPECVRVCLTHGWREENNVKLFTFFGWITDFFHEYVKTDERVSRFIGAKWLADILIKTREIHTKFLEFLNRYSEEAFQLHGKIVELYSHVNPQPNLPFYFEELKNASSDKILSFRKRFVDFVARDAEFALLSDFFDSTDNFSWGLLLGPAGIGKSRLAMEFGLNLRRRHNVNAGIITTNGFNEIKWDHWEPVCPTFIIVDDVSEISASVREALRSVYDRLSSGKRFKYPVRILLLERGRGEWWNEFEFESGISISSPGFQPIELKELPRTGLKDIIIDCIENSDSEVNARDIDMNVVMDSLQRIDNLGRPLFAIFAGIALSEGKEIRKWDRKDLLANYFKREQKIMSAITRLDAESLEQYRNLASLATMTGGLMIDDVEALLDKYAYLPPASNFDKTVIEHMSGFDPEEKRLMPIRPDLLGEYFVHAQLAPDLRKPFKDKGKRDALISEAWKMSPKSMSFFCVRFYQDLNYEPTMDALTSPANITTDEARFYFCNYALEISAHLIKSNSLVEVDSVCKRLIDICGETSSSLVVEKKNYVLFAIGILVGNLGLYPQSETEDIVGEIKLVRGDSYAWFKSEQNEISPERFELAKEIFEKSIRNDATYANHRYGLASLFHKRSDFATRTSSYQESEIQYNKAIELNERHALAHQGLGNLLKDCLARPQDAEKSFRAAIAIDERLPQAWHGLGNTLKTLDRYEESEKAYQVAIGLDSDFGDPWDGLGNLLRDFLDRPLDAEQAYLRAIELNERNAMPWNGLGNLFMDYFNDYSRAEEAYLRSLKINPHFAFPVDNLIFLYRDKVDRYKEAKELFHRNEVNLALNGANDGVYLHLAVFSAYEQKWEVAERYWREIFDEMAGIISYTTQFSWLRSLAVTVKLGYGAKLLALLEEEGYNVSYADLYLSVKMLQSDLSQEFSVEQIELKRLKRNFEYMKRFISY